MNTIPLIREQLKTAHQWFEGTMAGVTHEQAHWQPPGMAHPIGSRYAHAIVAEDVMVNVLIQDGAPLYATTWAGEAGISDPQFNATLEWARSVQVDLDTARRYAQAVYENTDAFLATLKEEELDRIIDLSGQGMGEWPLGAFLLTFVLGHIRDIMGELSALKGIQGLQGYPF